VLNTHTSEADESEWALKVPSALNAAGKRHVERGEAATARIGRKLGWIALVLGIPVAVQGQVFKEFARTAQMHDSVSLGFGDATTSTASII
jgi:hypothetical protein